MSKKKEKILDVVSAIDEDIIEAASRKRMTLWTALMARQKKRRAWIISASSVAASLLVLVLSLVLILQSGLIPGKDPSVTTDPIPG
ncbi:MAG: hypothetical protein IJW30_05555, partial [Clostridia bacterium]|nr:hypothetical protein [Clostridia bacterium]